MSKNYLRTNNWPYWYKTTRWFPIYSSDQIEQMAKWQKLTRHVLKPFKSDHKILKLSFPFTENPPPLLYQTPGHLMYTQQDKMSSFFLSNITYIILNDQSLVRCSPFQRAWDGRFYSVNNYTFGSIKYSSRIAAQSVPSKTHLGNISLYFFDFVQSSGNMIYSSKNKIREH